MAYLTYRQSEFDKTELESYHTKNPGYAKGSPLTMYEIDANFYALNSQIDDYKFRYGIAIRSNDYHDRLIGSVNKLVVGGVYKVLTTNSDVPVDSKKLNTVMIHAQAGKDAEVADTSEDITAFQIYAGKKDDGTSSLYFRTKSGQSTWSNWDSLTNNSTNELSVENIQNQIDQCIKTTGGIINGPLTINGVLTTGSITNVVSDVAVRGSTINTNSNDGITFYSQSGVNDVSKLGFVGLEQNSDGFSGVTLNSQNPSNSIDDSTYLKVGWTVDRDGNYVPTTYAPSPSGLDSNEIATTEYVKNAVATSISTEGVFTNKGGDIFGDLSVEGDLEVGGATITNVLTVTGGQASFKLKESKGNLPSAEQRVDNVGIRFVSSDAEQDELIKTGGQVYGSLDYQGNFTTEIAAFNWNNIDESSIVKSAISITVNKDGSKITTSAPTPSESDNGTQIATTEWVRKVTTNIANTQINQYMDGQVGWDMGEL